MSSENTGESEESEPDRQIPDGAFEDIYNPQPANLGFFNRCYRAVTDMDFYRLVAVEGWGRTLWFLTKLLLLVTVLVSTLMLFDVLPIVSTSVDNLSQQIKPVTLSQGEISVDGDVPHRLTLFDDYQVIIDPDAELNRVTLPNEVMAVFVDGGFYYRSQEGEFTFRSLSGSFGEDESVTITAETVQSYRTSLLIMASVAVVLGVLFSQLLINFVRVGLVSVGGWFLTRTGETTPLPFRTLAQFSCYVLVPIIGVDLLLGLFGLPVYTIGSTLEIILMVLGSLFLYQIHEHLRPDEKEPGQDDGDRMA